MSAPIQDTHAQNWEEFKTRATGIWQQANARITEIDKTVKPIINTLTCIGLWAINPYPFTVMLLVGSMRISTVESAVTRIISIWEKHRLLCAAFLVVAAFAPLPGAHMVSAIVMGAAIVAALQCGRSFAERQSSSMNHL